MESAIRALYDSDLFPEDRRATATGNSQTASDWGSG